ncbi:MAG: FKBP-type peptidyl-prolyl cis-trans isomerase [Actinomycetota bacterium]|nr:FKBP-type peptidyl-prolyl cis-trans isomerase [Actinomycetota bacterium]
MRRSFILILLMASLVVGACGGDKGGDGGGEASKPKVEIPDGPPPTELKIKDLKVGTGAEAVAGKTVTVHYVGVSWSDKEQFDASWDTGRPFPFILGAGDVIQGWDEGVVGMKVGGRRQLTIPPALAYREFGKGPIKPNETLVFVVDLLNVT